jgi:IS4 transposase
MHLTDGKFHEIKWAKKMLALPKGSFAVFDRGFNDYGWFSRLDRDGVFFVTRLKKNADVEFLTKRSGRKSSGISNDQQIRLNGVEAPLRLVQCIDPETGQEYRFLTNAHHLKAAEIAALYKERWQIEQFFKWIKQNLRIKTFLGTSKNAVLTQIWIALCAYLMIAFLNFKAKLGISMQRILRVLQLNLFSRCDLEELFKPLGGQPADSKYISLWV